MKPNQTAFRYLAALAIAALAAGCAGNLLDKENVAVAAGFKVITPTKPDQQALLRKLHPDKVTKINYSGKPYYVLPDVKNNQLYVGGPKQYQSYLQRRQIQEKNSELFEATGNDVPMDEINATDWGAWGGWNGIWGADGMGPPGWY